MSRRMIRCIAVDDEPWALALLTDYIHKIPFLELKLSTGNAIEALQLIQEGNTDLVFLDIQMPEITGIQFMKIIGSKCRVILTTAYSEYALDGYEHHVIDYLLKPISFDRFYTAAIRAREVLGGQVQAPVNTVIPEVTPLQKDYIFVKTDHKIVNIPLNEILFIEGLKDYIAIHTTREKIITLENLKAMENGLPVNRFIRVHKSYIISLQQVNTIERNRIFIGGEAIPIGDTYKEAFFTAIAGQHFG